MNYLLDNLKAKINVETPQPIKLVIASYIAYNISSDSEYDCSTE